MCTKYYHASWEVNSKLIDFWINPMEFFFSITHTEVKEGLSHWPKQTNGNQACDTCILTNSESASEKKHNKTIHCKLNLKVKTEINRFKKGSIKLQLFPPSWLTYCDKFPDRFIWFCSRSVVSLLECSDTMCNN